MSSAKPEEGDYRILAGCKDNWTNAIAMGNTHRVNNQAENGLAISEGKSHEVLVAL